jgi:uncharacterized Zn ribbon protein
MKWLYSLLISMTKRKRICAECTLEFQPDSDNQLICDKCLARRSEQASQSEARRDI